MQRLTEDYFKALTLGPGMAHENMTVFPLIHEAALALPYLPLDALDLLMQGQAPPKRRPKVDKWLQEVTELSLIKSPSLGLGEDLRLESQKVIGSGLMHEDTVLYLAVFPKNGGGVKSGMARASQRGSFTR